MGKFSEIWRILLIGAADSKKNFLTKMDTFEIYLSEEKDYDMVYDLILDIHDQREREKNRLKSEEEGQQRGEIPSDKKGIKNYFQLILFLMTFFKQEFEMSFLENQENAPIPKPKVLNNISWIFLIFLKEEKKGREFNVGRSNDARFSYQERHEYNKNIDNHNRYL